MHKQLFQHTAARRRLGKNINNPPTVDMFQHTAARRRLELYQNQSFHSDYVSTHSRPKAAGKSKTKRRLCFVVSTHSRPKAAGMKSKTLFQSEVVSTHSRPKAAGLTVQPLQNADGSFNTQPPEGGWFRTLCLRIRAHVSTHSRPKAAGSVGGRNYALSTGFNTQPPEGGWSLSQKPCSIRFRSPDFARLPRKARTRV